LEDEKMNGHMTIKSPCVACCAFAPGGLVRADLARAAALDNGWGGLHQAVDDAEQAVCGAMEKVRRHFTVEAHCWERDKAEADREAARKRSYLEQSGLAMLTERPGPARFTPARNVPRPGPAPDFGTVLDSIDRELCGFWVAVNRAQVFAARVAELEG
jgi:hypothetical protein